MKCNKTEQILLEFGQRILSEWSQVETTCLTFNVLVYMMFNIVYMWCTVLCHLKALLFE